MRKSALVILFAIVTGVSAFMTYFDHGSIYSACFGFGLVSIPPLNCTNIIDNVFTTVWGWWIFATLLGAIGLISTSYWLLKTAKIFQTGQS
jgi:hypothetical protein